MADSLFDPTTLAEAITGFQEFSAKFAAIAEEQPDPLESITTYIRSIPTTDTAKKTELAKFFSSEAGSKYTRAEREQAYNELLGRQRNLENMG